MFKDLGVIFIFFGLLLLMIGALFYLLGHTGFRMPFDIVIKGKNSAFYFPLGISLLISILLTLILSFIFKSK